jgi:hypothetical protein
MLRVNGEKMAQSLKNGLRVLVRTGGAKVTLPPHDSWSNRPYSCGLSASAIPDGVSERAAVLFCSTLLLLFLQHRQIISSTSF